MSRLSVVVAIVAVGLAWTSGAAAKSKPLAIIGATVFDGTGADPVPNAVVVVSDGKVLRIGSAGRVRIPAGAVRVDASGKWIIPGLVDSHVHFFQSGGLYTRPDILDRRGVRSYKAEVERIQASLESTFRRYLASGITTVMDVGGPMWNFEVRAKARKLARAPRVGVAGPLISTVERKQMDIGDPPIVKVRTPEEARALVRAQAKHAPELIKIWYIVPRKAKVETNLPIARATIDEAHKRGLRVAVHATQLEAARAAVQAGADVLVHSVDNAPVDAAFVRLLKERNVVYTPTLLVYEGYAGVLTGDPRLNAAERRYGDPDPIRTWAELGVVDPVKRAKRVARLKKRRPVMMRNLKTLHEAGVTIAAGTDAGNIGTLHGPSIYRELELMVQAGLSPRETIVAATRGASRIFGASPGFGTLVPGQAADLVILDADPLADIRNLRRIHRVVRAGQVFDPAVLVPRGPEAIVQAQLDAYNARDIEAFLATYTDDVRVMSLPTAKVKLTGKAALRKVYQALFEASPKLNCTIVNRTVSGSWVIDRELVLGIRGGPPIRAVALYRVRDGLIAEVWFLPKE